MRKTNRGVLLVSLLATANAFSEPFSFDDFKANWKFSGTMSGSPVGFQPELTDFDYDDSSWQSVDISTDYVPDSSRVYWFVRKKFYLEAGSITFSGHVDDDEIWTLIAPNGEYIEIGGDANDNDGSRAHNFTHTFTVTSPGFYIWAGRGHEGGGWELLSILEVTGLEFIQPGIECTYSIASTDNSHSSNSEMGQVDVIAADDCPWTAQSNISWANITSGSNGEGHGAVTYTIIKNTGAARSGTLTIAGQTFTLTQEANDSNIVQCPALPTYEANSGELHIPWVEVPGAFGTKQIFEVYLMQRPDTFTFDLDMNRVTPK